MFKGFFNSQLLKSIHEWKHKLWLFNTRAIAIQVLNYLIYLLKEIYVYLVKVYKIKFMPPSTAEIENILNQVKKLDYLGRISILEKIILLIENEAHNKELVKLSSLNGLGSEIWKNVDIDKFVENERQWD
ncbi:hypothetical protein AHMF7605_07610 [Adhaeribacter arboris]|uniref:Uncharacterized protein n=1 Tax=Adhaeribacter arboris TaxID=2072846 RepID=A0A2T2YD27_9BACT|nr:hypothetical protein [Adhaeribacter arboris]PSR53403.1 hypothetical protein AHMF7605_07610 [Adhaeribacter arboris]